MLDLVLDAGNMARRLASVARTYSFATDPELDHGPDDERLKDAAVKEFRELNSPDRLLVVMHKLKMHGLVDVSESLTDLEIEAGAVIQDLDYGEWTITEKEHAVFDAIECRRSRNSPGVAVT